MWKKIGILMATPSRTFHPQTMTPLEGVWAASITPLSPETAQPDAARPADATPDAAKLKAHIDWLLENGCHGVVLFGTTGEGPSFTVAEKRQLLDELAGAGAPMGRLMIGTGCAAIPDSIELTRHAARLGSAGALILPPFYFKQVTDDGLMAAMGGIFDGLGGDSIPVVLYHFPRMSGVGFSPALVDRLQRAYPELVKGIKDSSGDSDNLTSLCKQVDNISVFAGSEALLPYALNEGGAGCVSATMNVTSRLVRALYDGDNGSGEQVIRLRKALDALPFVSTMKHLIAGHLGDPSWRAVRPPLMPLTARQEQQLSQILDTIGTLPNFEGITHSTSTDDPTGT